MIAINAVLLGSDADSGVERCIRGLVEALAAYGELEYLVWARPGAGLEALNNSRFKVSTVRMPAGSRALRIFWEQMVLPWKMRRSVDLLHAPGYIAPLASSRPTVLTVYDLVALRFPDWASRANAWHYGALMPSAIRRAAAVVTLSQTVRAEILNRFELPAARVHVIPPSIEPLFYEPPPDSALTDIRRRYDLPERFILTVGNIEPKKNYESLLMAYHALCRHDPRTPCLIMAGQAAWKSKLFFQRRRELGLISRVRCLGRVPDCDLNVVYRLAEMLVQPSWYEGFGIPPLEAMACGTPVVASTGGALPETVADAALSFDPADVPALARAMADLLGNADLRRKLTARGREHVKKFTPASLAAAHEKLYREVAVAVGV